ncbi:hypothetical protein B0H13DRAFT_2044029 [Mycena leptocephala]|nr:hypothetical protein B0H13DRAFT_2044029 [Mycena leptocephala]
MSNVPNKTQWPSSETVQFTRMPAKQEPKAVVIVEPIIAQIITAQPSFPLPMENAAESTYEIRATPNMGLGMFAKRDLKAGDLVISERPALVFPNHFRASNPNLSKNADSEELEAAFGVALEHMRVEDRVAYRELVMGPRNSHAGDLKRIATTNNYQLPPNPPGGPNERWTIGDYRGVYLDVSRINHSCSPNTIADFDFLTFSFVVRAVREIKVGEEISTRYCGLDAPKMYRKQLLAFCMNSCCCAVCTNLAAVEASDARRMAIASYKPLAVVTHLAGSIKAREKSLADILQCVQNFDDEGLQSHLYYPMMLDICGRLAGMVGNQPLAETQKQKAEMFYGMRPTVTRFKNFVKWLFESEEKLRERLHWAVSHSKDFEDMLNGWQGL